MIKLIDLIKKYTNLEIKTFYEIKSGYTNDQKYQLIDIKDKKYFLRVSLKNNKNAFEFDLLKHLDRINFPSPKPISFFKHQKYSYLITSWVDGILLSDYVKRLSNNDQYQLGKKAGALLKDLHKNLIFSSDIEDFKSRKLSEFLEPFDTSKCLLEYTILSTYIMDQMHLFPKVAEIIEHSDFHLGNIILNQNQMVLFDFNGSHIGIIHDEFYKLELFDIEISLDYVKGVFDAYLKDMELVSFFRLHKVFLAISCISALRYGMNQNDQIFEIELKRVQRIIDSYQQYQSVFPLWMIEK